MPSVRRAPRSCARGLTSRTAASTSGLSELYALAASIVGKCHFCVQSHYALLKQGGMSVDQLRDAGRIAAVIAAAANAIEVEREAVAA